MSKNTFDVILVGGGIISSSIAYQLAKRQARVLIVEKNEMGCEASSAAAGMLGAQSEFSSEHPLIPLALDSRKLFPTLVEELEEVTKIDIGIVQKGLIKMATNDAHFQELISHFTFWKEQGEKVEWLHEKELQKLESNINHSKGAMYIPNDGQVRAADMTRAFCKAACQLGAVVKENTEVLDFLTEHDSIRGIKTTKGEFHAKYVVVAGGAWTNQLLKTDWVFPVKGECVSIVTKEPLVEATVFSKDGCYIVPKKGNRLFIGATSVPHSYDKSVSVQGLTSLLDRAQSLLPKLREGVIERMWSGIRPQTKDGLPILGEHPSIKGVWIASGHYRNGILLSPITGVVMADLIEGKECKYDLTPFQLERIYEEETIWN
ncbi:glycine oxidase ThiO [Bacillus kexueae]|uniref:glycine oxidase ThiO n=1 Tax=Aeribacillus kexueae TaxID=2078952 RepID=UPI001FAEFBBC|nr:glycine oxidase ThiO [Bacillus kexueae]